MNRKDYERLALALTQAKVSVINSVADSNGDVTASKLDAIERIHAMYAQRVAIALKYDNPNFKVDVFAAASCAKL